LPGDQLKAHYYRMAFLEKTVGTAYKLDDATKVMDDMLSKLQRE